MCTLKKLALLLSFFLHVRCIYAQEKFTLNGYIKDSLSAETLIGASITLKEGGKGVISNQYGFFSLTLVKGIYQLQVSYIGYTSKSIEVNFENNKTINVLLAPLSSYLNDITVITGKRESNTKSAQ